MDQSPDALPAINHSAALEVLFRRPTTPTDSSRAPLAPQNAVPEPLKPNGICNFSLMSEHKRRCPLTRGVTIYETVKLR